MKNVHHDETNMNPMGTSCSISRHQQCIIPTDMYDVVWRLIELDSRIISFHVSGNFNILLEFPRRPIFSHFDFERLIIIKGQAALRRASLALVHHGLSRLCTSFFMAFWICNLAHCKEANYKGGCFQAWLIQPVVFSRLIEADVEAVGTTNFDETNFNVCFVPIKGKVVGFVEYCTLLRRSDESAITCCL